jgi:hypothetical protein
MLVGNAISSASLDAVRDEEHRRPPSTKQGFPLRSVFRVEAPPRALAGAVLCTICRRTCDRRRARARRHLESFRKRRSNATASSPSCVVVRVFASRMEPSRGVSVRSGRLVKNRAQESRQACVISVCAYNRGMRRGSVVYAGFGGLPPVSAVGKTAYAAIAPGEVPGVRRVGRCIRVSPDVLLRWLAEGEGGWVQCRRGRR